MKFGRFYSMVAEGHDGTIAKGNPHIINFPLTCRFNVVNDNTFTYGTATFMIYNLAATTRADLFKDPLDILVYKKLIFSAGYLEDNTNPIIIFQGNIFQCYSYRQGADWITEIQAGDGAYMNDTGVINLSIKDGYSFQYLAKQLVSAMSPTVTMGFLSSKAKSEIANTRGITLSGSPWDILTRQCLARAFTTFIYKEKAYIVTQSEYLDLPGGVSEISGDTGMLGSPKIQAFQVIVRMIFEPKLVIQQRVHLTTEIQRMTGYYTVARVIHRGTISGAVCEDLATEVTLYRPNFGESTAADSALAGAAA